MNGVMFRPVTYLTWPSFLHFIRPLPCNNLFRSILYCATPGNLGLCIGPATYRYTAQPIRNAEGMACTSSHLLILTYMVSQWEIQPLGEGFMIRNVQTQKYLSIKALFRTAPVIATSYPTSWHINRVYLPDENAVFYE